jgi:hypothetical protein
MKIMVSVISQFCMYKVIICNEESEYKKCKADWQYTGSTWTGSSSLADILAKHGKRFVIKGLETKSNSTTS